MRKAPAHLADGQWRTPPGFQHQPTCCLHLPKLISYVSEFMTLLPGDIISTGSPAGVGMGLRPPRYLQAGDAVALRIEGLGQQQQVVAAYKEK